MRIECLDSVPGDWNWEGSPPEETRDVAIPRDYVLIGVRNEQVSMCTRICLGVLSLFIVPLFFQSFREKVFYGKEVVYYCAKASLPPVLDRVGARLLTAFNGKEEGWVMVPPLNQLRLDRPLPIGSGAIGYEGNGRWKIHVSISPDQMEQAIPILVDVLFAENAPRLGFKMQTRKNLDGVHQIGKELAIIFDKQVEAEAAENGAAQVQECLSQLFERFEAAEIEPEEGVVLTPETMAAVRGLPAGSQPKEKANLEQGKFDHAIPCPRRLNFFHYRDENVVPMVDPGELAGQPGIYADSAIIALATSEPQFAHNPSRAPDPFLGIRIGS